MNNALSVKEYNNFDVLKDIQQEWDDFVEANGADIFMTYDWCRIWWKYYGKGRELKIFIFRNDDELVGIIPLFFEKIRLGPVFVRAGKIVGSDFTITQFSLPIRDSFLRQVIDSLGEKLRDLNWDIVHIGPIAGKYGNFLEIKKAIELSFNSFAKARSENGGVQIYFNLAENWEQQISGLSRNERKKIKKSYQDAQCQTEPLTSNFASDQNFSDTFDRFVQMHQLRWQKDGKAGHFGDWPEARDFHREVAATQLKHKRLRLLEVKCGTKCLGFKYGYNFGKMHYAFLDARLILGKEAAGNFGRVLFAEQVKKAIEEKDIKCIDSMEGRYEQKLRMGGELYPIKSIYLIRKHAPLKLLCIFIFRALAKLLNMCYYSIWYCRLAPRLPFKRRPLWKIWIRTRL